MTVSYEQFLMLLNKHLLKKFGSRYQFIPNEILRTNGIVRRCLTIKNGDSSFFPSICMDVFYFDYINNKMNLEDIAKNVFMFYKQTKSGHSIDVSQFTDWNQVRHKIRCRLINTENNKDLLYEVPHREFLDLSIVYYLLVNMPNGTEGTLHICNRHLKLWNTNENMLYLEAWKNMQAAGDAAVRDINDIINSVSGKISIPNLFPGQMCILTNRRKLYGAIHMTNHKELKEFASKFNIDLLILPSSVHEVIIIPYDQTDRTAAMAEIVSEINMTELSPDEILSCHVYCFNRDTGRISIAA